MLSQRVYHRRLEKTTFNAYHTEVYITIMYASPKIPNDRAKKKLHDHVKHCSTRKAAWSLSNKRVDISAIMTISMPRVLFASSSSPFSLRAAIILCNNNNNSRLDILHVRLLYRAPHVIVSTLREARKKTCRKMSVLVQQVSKVTIIMGCYHTTRYNYV